MVKQLRTTIYIFIISLIAITLGSCDGSTQTSAHLPQPTTTNTSMSDVTPTLTVTPSEVVSETKTPGDQQLVDFHFPILFSFKYYDYDPSDILGQSQIYNLDINGNTQGQLPRYSENVVHYTDPAWSPDCQKFALTIYYRNEEGESYEVQGIMNLETHEIIEFSTPNRLNHSPSWSTDGKQIAFTALGEGNSQIYIYSVETESISQLTFDGFNYGPDWSPVNNQIIYVSEDEAFNTMINVVNTDGSGQREIIPSSWGSGSFSDPKIDSPYSPQWSPDGLMIAFQVREDALDRPVAKIYIARSDGSNPHRLVQGDRREEDPDSTDYFIQWESDPVWSPDGKEILYRRRILPTDEVQLCFAEVETGEVRCTGEKYVGIGVGGLDWCHNDQVTTRE